MDKVELDFEFALNSPEAKAEAEQVKKAITGIGDTAEQQAKRVQSNIAKMSQPDNTVFKKTQDQLKINAQFYEKIAQGATDQKTLVDYNRKVEQTTLELNRMKNAGKQGFDEMGNAIQKNNNVLGKAWSGVRNLAHLLPGLGIAGILAFATTPILNYIASLGIFKAKIDEVLASRKRFEEAQLKGAKDAQAEITQVRTLYTNYQNANLPLDKRKALYKELQAAYPAYFGNIAFEEKATNKTKTAYDNLTNSIIATSRARAMGDKITENESKKLDNEAKIRDLETKKREQESAANKNKQGRENALDTQQRLAFDKAAKDRADGAKQLQREITKINKENAQISAENVRYETEITNQIKKGAVITKDQTVKNAKDLAKAETERLAALARQADLQQRIQEITGKFDRGSLTKNEEEVLAIRAEFKKLAFDIEQFNANPKNKFKVDGTGLDKIRDGAINDLTYRQETETLRTAIEQQKKVYQDFEKYKDDLGATKAKERFQKQIDTEKSFLQLVEIELGKILDKDPTEMTGAEKERLEAFTKLQNEAQEAENQRQDETLKQFQTYAERRLRIQERYLRIAQEFRQQQRHKEAQEAIEQGNIELTSLDEANQQKWASYKNLFDFIGHRSKKQTLDAIAEFEKELNAANITAEARKEGLKKLAELKREVESVSGREINRLANDLSRIAGEFSSINGDIGNIAGVLVTAARSYVEIKEGLDNLNDPAKSTTEKVSAGLGIAGAVIGVASSIFNHFKGLKEAKEAARKAVEEYYQKAKQGELEYQSLLRQRDRDDVSRGKSSYKAIVDQLDLLKKQEPAIRAAYDKLFQSLQGQSFVSGQGSKHGTWLRKAKTWDIMSSLFGTGFEDLEKLDLQGKLTGQSKTDFDSLKALRDELKQAGVDAEELKIQLGELLTGTSASGLADGLTQLFANGKFAAQDFGDSFEEIMRNAFVNSFRHKYLEEAMQPIHAQLAELMQNGTPDQAAIDALRKKYEDVANAAANQWKTLEQVTGTNLTTGQPANNSSTVTNAIKGISADQADLLTGQFGGMRLGQLEGNTIARQNGATAMDQLAELRASYLTLVQIEDNTRRSATVAETYLPLLKSIDSKLSNNSNAAAAAGRG